MSEWELITEVKDTGYYIGWRREHKFLHMPDPMEPMGKVSLVQIGGSEGSYQVLGLTYAHSVFEPHTVGLKLFDEVCYCQTIDEAQSKATELKRKITKLFDDITRSDNIGKLILRPILIEV